jgi:hypothetical protein
MIRSMIILLFTLMVFVHATEQSGLRRLRDKTVLQIESNDEVAHVLASVWGSDSNNKQRDADIDFKGFFERNLQMSVSMSMSM